VTRSSAVKTCLISAPARADLSVLRTVLEARGLRVFVPQDMAVGTDWTLEIRNRVLAADLIIGILTADRQSQWVLFELGQAAALGRRIVLVVSPKADPIPFALSQFVVLRTDLDNATALGFTLDQVLSAPQPSHRKRRTQSKPSLEFGRKSNEHANAFEQLVAAQDWRLLDPMVGEVLRSSGADVVVTAPDRDWGVDYAVWSDALESFVGNPLLIEVKAILKGRNDAIHAARKLSSNLDSAGASWGLLLYGDGPDQTPELTASEFPNVLVLSVRSLLAQLSAQTFPEVVRDLRNQRVHGAIS